MRRGCLNLSLFKKPKEEKFLYFSCSFIQLFWIGYLLYARQQSKYWGQVRQMTTTAVIINLKYMKMCCKGEKKYIKKMRRIISCALYKIFENQSRSSNILLFTPFIHLDHAYVYFWREIKHRLLNEVFLSLLHIKLAAPYWGNHASLLWHIWEIQ